MEKRKNHKFERLLKNQRRQPIIRQSESTRQPEKFKNLSKQSLDPKLTEVLTKGPSFVNAEPRNVPRQCLEARTSLQVAIDKLKNNNDTPECAIDDLKGGIIRVNNECERLGPDILKSKRVFFKRPASEITITSTDKTKRLIALDTSQYETMVKESTISSGNYEVKN